MDIDGFEYFHDWHIDQIGMCKGDFIIHVRKYGNGLKKVIFFNGASRVAVDNFFIQNIIYDIKIFDDNSGPEYDKFLMKMDKIYPRQFGGTGGGKMAVISASVGLDGLVEFSELSIEDE